MKNLKYFAAVALTLSVFAAPASAGKIPAPEIEKIKAQIEKDSEGKVTVESVSSTPIPGLFEVTAGDDVFYSDATGRYVLVDGRLMDLSQKIDLTQASVDRVSRVDFSALPLNLAIKKVHGNGARSIAVFEDPTCPICKVLHKFIAQIPNLTVYTFPYPIASPEALPLTQSAWCSRDRVRAWSDVMAGNRRVGARDCDSSSINEILALGESLRIQGTPTVILGDGRRLVGAVPPAEFLEAINSLK